MIKDCEFLEGAAFIRLVNYGKRVTISAAASIHPSIYLFETEAHQSAILFKHSTKPKSSWSFTLSPQEEKGLKELRRKYPDFRRYIAFICHQDGICCVFEKDLISILNTDTDIAGQHISISRKARGSYSVSGPGRQKMSQSVPQSDWPRVVLSKPKEKLYE